jgi:hypothetical protein
MRRTNRLWEGRWLAMGRSTRLITAAIRRSQIVDWFQLTMSWPTRKSPGQNLNATARRSARIVTLARPALVSRTASHLNSATHARRCERLTLRDGHPGATKDRRINNHACG